MKLRLCVNCVEEWYDVNHSVFPVKKARPAPHPGPRCTTHHRVVRKRRQEAAADSKRVVRYGITGTAYRALLEAQGGCCAGCGIKPGPKAKRLAVDHDHIQARLDGHPHDQACMNCIRGLVCHKCNSTLADYRDNEEQLRSLVFYLEKWRLRNFPERHMTGIETGK